MRHIRWFVVVALVALGAALMLSVSEPRAQSTAVLVVLVGLHEGAQSHGFAAAHQSLGSLFSGTTR